MSHFDIDMMAIFGLMLLLGGFTLTFLKEMIVPMITLFLLLIMVWSDDICSRNDRLSFYGSWFDRGGEIVCKDNNDQPILISKLKGWEHKGEYLFKDNRGIEILEDKCEIINQSEPHCIPVITQIIIGTSALIGIFGWMLRRLNESRAKTKKREERKAAIEKGVAEMAELYKSDPELKEWNEFVGDHFDEMEQGYYHSGIAQDQNNEYQKSKNVGHLMAVEDQQHELKDREIRERDYEDDDDTKR